MKFKWGRDVGLPAGKREERVEEEQDLGETRPVG
jgi:hypothetical protein